MKAAGVVKFTTTGKPITHGYSTYVNWGCRCVECREANAADKRKHQARRLPRSVDAPHGTFGGYTNWGCRCPECTAANTAYSRQQRAKAKS